jgi:transcriptional regulator with XRE-family HTH domain
MNPNVNTRKSSRGARLRRARQRLGLSQVDLAVAAGCSLNTVSLAERSGYFTERMAAKFAAALQCKPEDLLP